MNEQVTSNDSVPSHSSGRTIWLAVIGAAAVIAIGANLYEVSQTDTLRRQVVASQQDNNQLHAKLVDLDTQLQAALGSLHQDMADARQASDTSVMKAQQAAQRHADLVARKQGEEAQQQAQQLSDELGHVKETTEQATAKLEGISTDVGSVKTQVGSVRSDVDTAKTNIDATNTELQRVRGDMGVMSGLVATNGKEIQMLRDLGDRNIYEFTLTKTVGAQKVGGDVQLSLRNADVKRNRYTVDVVADDKRVEKKDKGTNEPVQFYTASARQPYELVVNTVGKNQISGYLATPKVTLSRAANTDTH